MTPTPFRCASAMCRRQEQSRAPQLDPTLLQQLESCHTQQTLVEESLATELIALLRDGGAEGAPKRVAVLTQAAQMTSAALVSLRAACDLQSAPPPCAGQPPAKRAREAEDPGPEAFSLARLAPVARDSPRLQLASAADAASAEFAARAVAEPLLVVENLLTTLGVDGALFSLERLREAHGAQRVTVLPQRSQPTGFGLEGNQRPGRAMALRAAVDQVQQADRDAEWVPFCPNVDMSAWDAEVRALGASVPAWMWSVSAPGLLRLLRQGVGGVSSPQCYLKAPGVWTAAHRESVCMNSVNCNHGPGASLWLSVREEHVPALRALVRQTQGADVDILALDGAWFPDPAALAAAGIPVDVAHQRAGDVVVLRGGTMHWVRGEGVAVHTCWSVMPATTEALRQLVDQHVLNERLSPPVGSIVPVMALCLDAAREIVERGVDRPSRFWGCAHMPRLLRAFLAMAAFSAREEVAAIARVCGGAQPAKANAGNPPVLRCACSREVVSAFAYCASCSKNNDIRSGAKRRKKRMTLYQTVYCAACAPPHAADKPHHNLQPFIKEDPDAYLAAAGALDGVAGSSVGGASVGGASVGGMGAGAALDVGSAPAPASMPVELSDQDIAAFLEDSVDPE